MYYLVAFPASKMQLNEAIMITASKIFAGFYYIYKLHEEKRKFPETEVLQHDWLYMNKGTVKAFVKIKRAESPKNIVGR